MLLPCLQLLSLNLKAADTNRHLTRPNCPGTRTNVKAGLESSTLLLSVRLIIAWFTFHPGGAKEALWPARDL